MLIASPFAVVMILFPSGDVASLDVLLSCATRTGARVRGAHARTAPRQHKHERELSNHHANISHGNNKYARRHGGFP